MSCFVHSGDRLSEPVAAGTRVYFEDFPVVFPSRAYAWKANPCGHTDLNPQNWRFRAHAALRISRAGDETGICRGETSGTETLVELRVTEDEQVTPPEAIDQQVCS